MNYIKYIKPLHLVVVAILTVVCVEQGCSPVRFWQVPPAASVSKGDTGGETIARTYSWNTQNWSTCSTTCGSGSQDRDVSCIDNKGKSADISFCPSPAPIKSQACRSESSCARGWFASSWSDCSSTCGEGNQTRTLKCFLSDGEEVSKAQCEGVEKPRLEQKCTNVSACSYRWTPGASWGNCSTSCGTGVQTRENICTRSDGTVVDKSLCAASTLLLTTQSCESKESCTYKWNSGNFSSCSNTCGVGEKKRAVTCQRSDGSRVPESLCPANSAPSAKESCTDTSTCSYSWATSDYGNCSVSCGNGTKSRDVSCKRSDGTTVTDEQCLLVGSKPSASTTCSSEASCTYKWVSGGFSNSKCSNLCGPGTKTQTVSCQRSDGTPVDNSLCPAGEMPALTLACSDTSSCTNYWSSIAQGSCSNTCGTGISSIAVTCTRSDGATIPNSECKTPQPPTQAACTDFSSCTFDWSAGSWGSCSTSCGPGTRNRSVSCQRSDKTAASSPASCQNKPQPLATEACTSSDSCTFTWTSTGFGACSNRCGTGTQTQFVSCLSSDGTDGGTKCPAASQPPMNRTCADYTGCSYGWQTSAYNECSNSCGAGSQTRSASCVRSDGSTVNDGICAYGFTKPATSQDCVGTTACSYAWNYGAWGACSVTCGGGSQTRTATCVRSDGVTVADSLCSNPVTSQYCHTYDSCPIGTGTGAGVPTGDNNNGGDVSCTPQVFWTGCGNTGTDVHPCTKDDGTPGTSYTVHECAKRTECPNIRGAIETGETRTYNSTCN